MHSYPPDHTNPIVEHPDRGAARIYTAIFGQSIPSTILDRFMRASKVLDKRTSDSERVLFDTALDRIGDLEALELAARYTRRLTTLSDRFRLMVYIGETDPDLQHFYVAPRMGFVRGVGSVVAGAFRTAAKMVKGWFLLKRLGHA